MANIFKITRFIAALALILTYSSCEDDNMMEPETPAYEEIDVVTGLDLYDFNGNPLGRWKFPNNNPGENRIYPIPCTDKAFVQSQTNITKLWLVPASCISDSTTMNIQELSSDLSYNLSEIEAAQSSTFELTTPSSNVDLNLSDVPPGFYRLFIQLENDEIYWKNIYTDHTVNSFPDFSVLDEGCD